MQTRLVVRRRKQVNSSSTTKIFAASQRNIAAIAGQKGSHDIGKPFLIRGRLNSTDSSKTSTAA
jgi:hypothetical protein